MRRMALAIVLLGVVSGSTSAQGPQKPGPEQRRFEAFVGTWDYTGEARLNPYGPAGKIVGTDVFEMLPGGFFLTHRWDEKNPLGALRGFETWGYDALKKGYTFNYYTSFGEMGSGTISVAGNLWTFESSGLTFEGKRAWSRCRTTVASATRYTVSCDASADGTAWTNAVFTGTWTKR